MANITIEAVKSESVPDGDIELDKADSLEARYAEIFRLWQYRHKLEEEQREGVYDFLDKWSKAYTLSKTNLDFDRILGGFEIQNKKKPPNHISDLLYKRYLDFTSIDPNKSHISAKEGNLSIADDRFVYSLTPTKVEMQRARDTDQPIELTWEQAFAMADDALANARMLPPNTMRLQGSAGNRIKLEAALKIRSEGWPKEHKPVIENSVGFFKIFNPANYNYGLKKSDYDPDGVLAAAKAFAEQAYKDGTSAIPPSLGENLEPLTEKIDEINARKAAEETAHHQNPPIPEADIDLEPEFQSDIVAGEPVSDIENEQADAHVREHVAFNGGVHNDTIDDVLSDATPELSPVEVAQEQIDNARQTLEELAAADQTLEQPPEPVQTPQEEITDPVARTVAASEESLHMKRDTLGPYPVFGEHDGQTIYEYSQASNEPGKMDSFYFTDHGDYIHIVKIKNGDKVYFEDSDPEMLDALAMIEIEKVIESNNQFNDKVALEEINNAASAKAAPVVSYHPNNLSSENPAGVPTDTSLDIANIVAEEGRRLIAEVTASGLVSHIGDDATYKQIVDFIVSHPHIFHDKKTRNLDKLLDTVNSAAHVSNPNQPPLVMDNDLLVARLESDGIIQTKPYDPKGKTWRGVSKVSTYDNFIPDYDENGKLTYREDPVYKALTQDILNAPAEWKGKGYAEVAAKVSQYRDEFKWARAMSDKEMSKKFWSDLKTSGIVTTSDNSLKAEITQVHDGLLNTARFGGLRNSFNKAAGFMSPEQALALQAQREKEREIEANEKEKKPRNRTPLSEEMDNVANLPVPYVPPYSTGGPWAAGPFPSAAMK